MRGRGSDRRRAVVLGLLSVLAFAPGCATEPSIQEAESVPRPEWKVGDRWVFRRTSLAGTVGVVTHQVTEASGEGYTMRVAGLAQEIARYWTVDLHVSRQTAGGVQSSSFQPAAMYFVWPLTLGKEWTQEFEYRDGRNDGRYANSWRVGTAVEAVDVVAGRFYALRVDHWGSRRERLDTYWYVPRVRYWVKLENYLGGYTEELVEFRPES